MLYPTTLISKPSSKRRRKGVRLELNMAQIKPKNVLTWSCSRRKKLRGRRTLLVDHNGNEKNMKNSIVLMLLLVISNVAHADISFTEQEIPKVIANNGYEFTVPYFELETPFGVTAYTVKLIAPPGQLTFSVDLSTLQEVTLKPRVSITKPTGDNAHSQYFASSDYATRQEFVDAVRMAIENGINVHTSPSDTNILIEEGVIGEGLEDPEDDPEFK